MPAIFRTDSGIFGDIEASNMTVTGEVRVGASQTTIDQYISAEVNTVIGDGIDYSAEINNLSGQISGVSGYATGLSGIVDIATGKINTLSGQITGITGDVGEISGFLADLDTSAHYSDSDVATYLGGNLDSHIIPDTNSTYDIGSAEKKIRHLYLSNNSLYIGGEEGQTGTQISATPEGGIVLPSELNVSGIKISGAIGGVTPNAENNSIQWNTGTKQWESSDTLHTATGDLYSFYKRDNDIISNVSGSFDALNFKPTAIPTSKTSEGAKGQITYDENYVYLCVADNTWKRLPSADF